MPNAVTHVIIAIVLIDLFRKYVLKKKNFPLYLILIGGIAGLLPDIDILIYWILQTFTTINISEVHRIFTHTFFIPLIFLLLALAIWKFWPKISHVLFVLSAGWTTHILLDVIFTSRMQVFYPISLQSYGLGLIPMEFLSGTFYLGLDAIILILWLVYEYHARNLKDYI